MFQKPDELVGASVRDGRHFRFHRLDGFLIGYEPFGNAPADRRRAGQGMHGVIEFGTREHGKSLLHVLLPDRRRASNPAR